MATVLALLASGRAHGFTASLLDAAVEGAQSVDGVDVRRQHLHRHRFGPCTSCFNCIRNEAHECTLRDAMGADGALMAEVKRANAIVIADAVHFWGPSAQSHLFIERCYPFVWSGELVGMPFGSISCASNQGMQRLATRELCKWAFTLGLRYVGGLPAHTAYLDRARRQARDLGRRLGEAAVADARGRLPYPERQRYVDYLDAPWRPVEPYLENLTGGTMAREGSMIDDGLCTFRRDEALSLLREARRPFDVALALYQQGRCEEAVEQLVRASALWTHATWKEFLEEDVIGATVPPAYRPIGGGDTDG
jgi:multimeric flavodoxin WrbA